MQRSLQPSNLELLQSIGNGCYLDHGNIQAPALVRRYRSPSLEVAETLKGVSTKIDAWLTILPPERQGGFLAQLMKQGHDVVDDTVVDAIGRSLLED